jgi:hypothetical protein
LGCAQIGHGQIEPRLHLPIDIFEKTDRAGFGDTLQSGGNVDAVAHQIAVAFLDHVAKVNTDAKLDAALGRQASVALDHAVLHLDGAADGINNAAKLNEDAVARPLDDAAVMQSDGRVDQIAAERA